MSALRDIHKQFRDRSVKKTYECIVKGAWPEGLKKISNAFDTKKTNAPEQKTVNT